ncbi:MAG: phosphoribosylanthranilate isomerase [Kiritimatiellaeota bacterium]|nr:phosphoribosylanthranilate isomerase [Kiritimatiellota bacterium]
MINGLLIKVCGITRACDAEACVALGGVDFCGFVFHPPSPRNMTPQDVAHIRTGGGGRRVGVFTTHDTDEILRTMEIARLDFAQLHAGQDEACAEAIGAECVIRVCFAVPAATHRAAFLLFDKPFDWRTMKEEKLGMRNEELGIGNGEGKPPRAVPQPYFIAGGLDARNIREAVSCGAPSGVDLNSGVESAPGVKDVGKIKAVLEEIGRSF